MPDPQTEAASPPTEPPAATGTVNPDAPVTPTPAPPAPEPVPPPEPAPPPQPQLSSADQAALAREREALVREVSFDPKTPWEANQVARYLSMSTLLPEGIRSIGKWDDKKWLTQQQIQHNLVGLIMWGRQWKLPVWTAINVHIIEGRPTLPAAMMVAIVQESTSCHYLDFVEEGDGFATWETVKVRKDGSLSAPMRMSFTREQANKLGYYDKATKGSAAKNQWNTQEGVMLRWRAATAGIRVWYPGLIHGLHSTEELIDAIEVGGVEIETIRTQRSDIDNARRGNPIILGLAPPAPKDEMDKVFDQSEVSEERVPVTVPAARARTSGERLKERATQLGKCPGCGGPIPAGDTICDACRNE